MKDNKYISRFMASLALLSIAYGGYNMVMQAQATAAAEEVVKPLIYLTGGDVIDPATAPETTKFDKNTARDFAEMIFGEAEETPDINEFLSRFLCDTCGKGCLLASPFCFVGQGNKELATELYQEMYPDVELFHIGEDIFSML